MKKMKNSGGLKMKDEIKQQLLKSATAVICVAGVCIASINSVDKIATTIKDSAVPIAAQGEAQSTDASGSLDSSFVDGGEAETGIAVDDGSLTPDASGDAAQETPTGDSSADSSAKPSSGSASGTSSTPSSTKKASSGPQTKAEIINYCNTALNKAKSAKIGYNKKMVRTVKGDTAGISQSLIKLVAADKKSTMKKGNSDIKDDFPAAGFDWSSKLREQDVQNATIKANGQYYEIRLTLGKEKNPAKGEASSYGRVMSVIDATEAGNIVPGIKSINMDYHDGYVYAKIDSKTGKLVAAEFSASADIQASIAIFGDVSVKDIVSTETFTDIVW